MPHPIVQKILAEGIRAVDVSMLSSDARKRIMSEAGDRLLHMGKLAESAEAYALGGDVEKLRASAEWLLEQRRFDAAALFLRPIGSPDELESLAEQCMRLGNVKMAKALYEELGNTAMAQFLKENFLRS